MERSTERRKGREGGSRTTSPSSRLPPRFQFSHPTSLPTFFCDPVPPSALSSKASNFVISVLLATPPPVPRAHPARPGPAHLLAPRLVISRV